MPEWMADVKAELARLGQTLAPEAKVDLRGKPYGQAGAVVVLEPVKAGVTPDYCTHGYASCLWCDHLCWLGSETSRMVTAGEAWPICLPCARQHMPADAKRIDQVDDHLRRDGPH